MHGCGSPSTTPCGQLDGLVSCHRARCPQRAALQPSKRADARADLRGGRAFPAAELSRSGWLDLGAFRWRDLAVAEGVRGAIGVLTPLVIGVATGRVESGSFAALGALPAGFVSFRGVSRTRVLAVLCASAGMAVSTFTGATAALKPPLLSPVVFAWAYAVGLLASLGPTVLAVTLQWPVALGRPGRARRPRTSARRAGRPPGRLTACPSCAPCSARSGCAWRLRRHPSR